MTRVGGNCASGWPLSRASEAETPAPILVIAGPTAIGKTAIAIKVAALVSGEIVSADSVAVYRGMDVGSAKPSPSERLQATFHLLDVADPDQAFSAARFTELARAAIDEIRGRGHVPIIVGGTGLYIRALTEGVGLLGHPADRTTRAQLEARAASEGVRALYGYLERVDPVTAARLHPNDKVRIVRALEVHTVTGRRMSELIAEDVRERRPIPSAKVILTMDRAELDRRIDARVDAMMHNGLEFEVRRLLARGSDRRAPALRALGYKEMVDAVSGSTTIEEAVGEIKRNTRRFARRQLTWFRQEPGARWVDITGVDTSTAAELVLQIASAGKAVRSMGVTT